jgi:hypothetical protein
MDTVRWVGFAVGVILLMATAANVVVTVVTPRGSSRLQLPSLAVNRTVRLIFVGLSRPVRTYEAKDALLAPVGPVALVTQLGAWLTLFWLGFALAQWPYVGAFSSAGRTSASSLFTVGFGGLSGSSNFTLVVAAAATGPIVIALQIAYLPAIYAAFNRREALVALLESRAGLPAWGPELLVRHQLVGITDTLPALYGAWEAWEADLAESHTSYPVLLLFRSPEPWYSWVLAMLAVLDAAALHLSLCPSTAPSEARLCLRMGFSALRRIARSLGWPFDPDPLPDAPIEITYDEFEGAVEMLGDVGFPVERTATEAWPHFQGWRVNYEPLVYRLADRIVVPPGPWSGPRRHLRDVVPPRRPPHRSPDGTLSFDDRSGPASGGIARRSGRNKAIGGGAS